jgi:hypothetical protein
MLKSSQCMADGTGVVSEAPKSSPPPGGTQLWGGHDSGQRPAPAPDSPEQAGGADRPTLSLFGEEALTPTSRRLLQIAAALSLLLVLVVANSVMHGGESPLALSPLNPVAAAAQRTQEASGARFTMRVLYSSGALPHPVLARGGGAYNAETGAGRALLHVPVPDHGVVDIESVSDGDGAYIRSPLFAGKLPEGKEWLKIDGAAGQSEESAVCGDNADKSVAMMSIAHSVQRLGRQDVQGTQTTHYRVFIDLSQFANLLRAEGRDELADEYGKMASNVVGTVRGEAWVDDGGLLRRSRTVMTTIEPSGTAITTDIRIDLSDFEAEPDIAMPDSDRVFEASSDLQEALGTSA